MIIFSGTIIKDEYNYLTAFQEIINNSIIEYIPTQSTYNILFKITYNKNLSSPYYKYKGNLFYEDTNIFLLKLVITDFDINNKNNNICNNSFFISGLNRYFSIINKNDFIQEVNIHNNIYLSCYYSEIDPITTCILYFNYGIHNLNIINSFLIKKINNFTYNTINEINKFIIETNSNIGIIITECFDNIETFNNIYPLWNLNPQLLDILPNKKYKTFNPEIKSQKIPYLFIYEILKLYYYTGYIHGDPNLDNIIFFNNYNTLKGINGKIFIINFGKTYKIIDHNNDIIFALNENIKNNFNWNYLWLVELLDNNRISQTLNSIEYIKKCRNFLIQYLQNNAKYMRINKNTINKNSTINNPYYINEEIYNENNKCIEKYNLCFTNCINDITSIIKKNETK